MEFKMLHYILLFISLFSLLSWSTICTRCSLRISEVRADSINKVVNDYGNLVEIDEYIELIAVNCLQGEIPKISAYVLLLVEEYDNAVKRPVVVLSADLINSQFSATSSYFVIGSSYLSPVANLSFDNPNVMYLRKSMYLKTQRDLQLSFVYNNLDLTDMLENGNNAPMGILLLCRDKSSYDVNKLLIKTTTFNGDKNYQSAILIDKLQHIILHSTVDICVYARKHFVTFNVSMS